MTILTRRQTEVLEVIRSHIQKTGAPPTRAEIAKTLGFRSVNAAEDHLKALARKGAIQLVPGTSRGIQLAKEHGVGLPIIHLPSSHVEGSLFAEKHIHGRLAIQADFFHPTPDYLLKMPEDSTELGVKKGDYLLIHQSQEAPHTGWVVGRLNHKLSVKRAHTTEESHTAFVVEGICVGWIRSSLD